MGEDNLKISRLGQNYSEEYQKFGENILQETANNLAKHGIFPQRHLQTPSWQEPIKGLAVEHQEAKDEKPTEKEDNSQSKGKSKETVKTNLYKKDRSGNFSSSSKSTTRDSYSKLASKESQLHTQDITKMSEQKAETEIGQLVDTMEDIDDLGKQHIADLHNTVLPDNGMISGGLYFEVNSNQGKTNASYRATVKNSWQNSAKNFGIVVNGNIGYKINSNSENNDDDFDFSELSYLDDEDENIPSAQQTSSAQQPASEQKPVIDEKPVLDSDTQQTENERKNFLSGDISVRARYSFDDFIVGGGVAANIYSPNHKILDINATVIYSGIGADLIRRTNFVKNSEGKVVPTSEMKLKLDLINNKNKADGNSKNNNATPVKVDDSDIEVSDAEISAIAYNQGKGLKVGGDGLASKDEADATNQEIFAFYNSRAGKGFDLDFEYDSSKCGFVSTYGFNIVNKPDKGVKFQASPVLGLHDYNSPGEKESKDAIQLTVGGIADFSKIYADGSELSCRASITSKRIMEQEAKPLNFSYITFEGNYDNPKKNLYVGLEAGYIKTDMNFSYINANVNKDYKNFNVRLNAGATRTKGLGLDESDYQVSAQVTYTIPYGKKNK